MKKNHVCRGHRGRFPPGDPGPDPQVCDHQHGHHGQGQGHQLLIVPRHNVYELVWFLKTGFLRMLRMFFGLEQFEFDLGILLEGYQHYTP